MNRKRRICANAFRDALALMMGVLVVAVGILSAQQKHTGEQQAKGRSQQDETVGDGKVELLHVQGNVYMIGGAGANITVQVGDHVVLVDAGVPQMSDEVLAAIRSVTDKRILYIIDTSADEDHIGGNATLSKAGVGVPNQAQTAAPTVAAIVAHYNVLSRISAPTGKQPPFPTDFWPTDTYETSYWRLYNGEGIFLYHPPNAHSDADSYVLFRSSDVVSTGDIFTLASYPVIKADQGGSINGVIDALNQIIQLLEPKENEEGGTYVIPGHGHICDRNDVVNYRDMVTIIRDRIRHLIKQGMTLEQVKAARPTFDYDGIFGATTGPWTTDMFVEAAYRDLSKSNARQEQKSGGGR